MIDVKVFHIARLRDAKRDVLEKNYLLCLRPLGDLFVINAVSCNAREVRKETQINNGRSTNRNVVLIIRMDLSVLLGREAGEVLEIVDEV